MSLKTLDNVKLSRLASYQSFSMLLVLCSRQASSLNSPDRTVLRLQLANVNIHLLKRYLQKFEPYHEVLNTMELHQCLAAGIFN